MSDDYVEPSNEQLAKFMVVYSKTDPRAAELHIDHHMLERIFDRQEKHRQACLKIHRRFQQEMLRHTAELIKGGLQCEYIRPNGKRCPNFNQSGSYFCGLHQESQDEDGLPSSGVSDV